MEEKILCDTCNLRRECKHKKIYTRTQNFLNSKQKEKNIEDILHIKCDKYK